MRDHRPEIVLQRGTGPLDAVRLRSRAGATRAVLELRRIRASLRAFERVLCLDLSRIRTSGLLAAAELSRRLAQGDRLPRVIRITARPDEPLLRATVSALRLVADVGMRRRSATWTRPAARSLSSAPSHDSRLERPAETLSRVERLCDRGLTPRRAMIALSQIAVSPRLRVSDPARWRSLCDRLLSQSQSAVPRFAEWCFDALRGDRLTNHAMRSRAIREVRDVWGEDAGRRVVIFLRYATLHSDASADPTRKTLHRVLRRRGLLPLHYPAQAADFLRKSRSALSGPSVARVLAASARMGLLRGDIRWALGAFLEQVRFRGFNGELPSEVAVEILVTFFGRCGSSRTTDIVGVELLEQASMTPAATRIVRRVVRDSRSGALELADAVREFRMNQFDRAHRNLVAWRIRGLHGPTRDVLWRYAAGLHVALHEAVSALLPAECVNLALALRSSPPFQTDQIASGVVGFVETWHLWQRATSVRGASGEVPRHAVDLWSAQDVAAAAVLHSSDVRPETIHALRRPTCTERSWPRLLVFTQILADGWLRIGRAAEAVFDLERSLRIAA